MVELVERRWFAHADNWLKHQDVIVDQPEPKEEEIVVVMALPECAVFLKVKGDIVSAKGFFNVDDCCDDVASAAGTNRHRILGKAAVSPTRFVVLVAWNTAVGVVLVDFNLFLFSQIVPRKDGACRSVLSLSLGLSLGRQQHCCLRLLFSCKVVLARLLLEANVACALPEFLFFKFIGLDVLDALVLLELVDGGTAGAQRDIAVVDSRHLKCFDGWCRPYIS